MAAAAETRICNDLKVVIFFLNSWLERNETKKERKIVEGDKKREKNSTGQARGLEYLKFLKKRRDRYYIPENPSNQNIFGDAKRFTKVNALHVSKKKKKKKRNASSPS